MEKTGWHIVWGLAIIGIIIWLVWSATHTNTENNRYGAGTIPINPQTTNYGLVNFNPCGVLFKVDDRHRAGNKT